MMTVPWHANADMTVSSSAATPAPNWYVLPSVSGVVARALTIAVPSAIDSVCAAMLMATNGWNGRERVTATRRSASDERLGDAVTAMDTTASSPGPAVYGNVRHCDGVSRFDDVLGGTVICPGAPSKLITLRTASPAACAGSD